MPRYLTATFTTALLAMMSSLFPTPAFAQEAWAVQTAAFRDFRDAGSVVAQLERLGYDAYSEFTMEQGKQYSRVRVGCFLSRPLAESMAAQLRSHVTAEAVVVPFTPGRAASACIAGDIGFRLPERWGVVNSEPSSILFWVELSGRRGYLAYDGTRWQVIQTEEAAEEYGSSDLLATTQLPSSPLQAQGIDNALPATFSSGGSGAVSAELGSERLLVAHGEILWRSARTAVVRTGDRITAVKLLPPLE